MRQSFFLRGKYLGSTERKKVWVHETLVPPSGIALFCPICAEIWLLAPIEGRKTFAFQVECEKHPEEYPHLIPGSVLLPWDEDWNKALPVPLLKRELILQIDSYLKEPQNEISEVNI